MTKTLAFVLITILLTVSCDTAETKRDRFFLQGNVALNEREHRQAITHFSNALTVDPDFALAYNNRGVALMEAARPFEAIQDYNQAILIQPDYWEAIYNRANAYEVTKQYPKSLRDIEFLLNEFPDSITFEFFKGLVYTQMDSLKKAADTFEKVWNQDGTNIEALINWATVLYYQTDYQAAIKLLEEAVEIDPSQANAFNTMNQLLGDVGDHRKALQAVNKALDMDRSNPIFLNNRGYTYLMLDSLRLAIQDINASLVRDPDNMWAFRNKGIYFLKTGDYDQAERYLKQVIEASDYAPNTYTYLAEVYQQQGEVEKAKVTLSKEKQGHIH
ncbi:MAG: tetratricopeptide repeat protein [Cyclobacteriaceae bacterium]|jgi:tetratricopeptide (TPR) repeat protein